MKLVITMSRRYGTGASRIAQELSERLGIPVYDKVNVEEEMSSHTYDSEVEVIKKLAEKPFCTNSYDSAVGGAYEICGAIGDGQSISQAIEEYKPIYQRMVDQANSSEIEDVTESE